MKIISCVILRNNSLVSNSLPFKRESIGTSERYCWKNAINIVEIVHRQSTHIDSTLGDRRCIESILDSMSPVAITTNSKDVDVIAVSCLKTLNALLHYSHTQKHVKFLNCINDSMMITHFFPYGRRFANAFCS